VTKENQRELTTIPSNPLRQLRNGTQHACRDPAFPPQADWRHAGRRGVRWNVVGDITHKSGVKLHITFAECVSPAEAEFWAAIWPPAASIICTFGHGFPVGG
jgi:hypothetical protein